MTGRPRRARILIITHRAKAMTGKKDGDAVAASRGGCKPAGGGIRAAPEAADGNRPVWGREYGPPVVSAVKGVRRWVTGRQAAGTNWGGTARMNLVP